MFVSDEDVDVFSDLSLLGCDAISNPRVEEPQRSQRVGHGCGRGFYFNLAASSSEFAQCTGDVKGHGHDHLLPGRDLYVADLLVADLPVPALSMDARRDLLVTDSVAGAVETGTLGDLAAESPDVCSNTALRMQTTDGSPSRIFSQFLPSSREPKI
jgi:hypothetical protein